MQIIEIEGNFLQNLILSDQAIFTLKSEANSCNDIQYVKRGKGHPNDHYVEFEQGEDNVMVWLWLTGEALVLDPTL